MNKKIYLSSPTMNGTEMGYIEDAFAKNWIAPLGENVDCFEQEFAQMIQVPYGAALVSGTSALHLALKILGIGEGDYVFSSDLTFAATCNPITYVNAIPVFIDAEEDSWNMDPEALRRGFEKYPQAKAVVVAHLYGVPAKMDEIKAICLEHQVPLIEDAAESLGATYHGTFTGNFGQLAAFSFNGNKIITTSGGGMLVGSDQEQIQKARFYATQAREPYPYYEHKEIGYNYRMSNIVAGIGRGQLHSLMEFVEKKKWIYEYYQNAFRGIEAVRMNPYLEDSQPNFWLSCMTVAENSTVKPENLIEALQKEAIEARPIWKPMHLQPVYADRDFIQTKEKSVGETVFQNGLCLPSDVKNTEEDMERITEIIKNLFR